MLKIKFYGVIKQKTKKERKRNKETKKERKRNKERKKQTNKEIRNKNRL